MPFLKLSGTSMAAGVTSGVVALVLEAHHEPRDLLQCRQPLTPQSREGAASVQRHSARRRRLPHAGRGEINAAGAVALAACDRHLGQARRLVAALGRVGVDDDRRADRIPGAGTSSGATRSLTTATVV